MTGPNLTCAELVELVTDYLEGALSPEESDRFERHLEVCAGCTAYVEQFGETIRLTGMLREQDVSADARATLLAEFADWKRGRAYREASAEVERRIRALWDFLVDMHELGRPRRATPP